MRYIIKTEDEQVTGQVLDSKNRLGYRFLDDAVVLASRMSEITKKTYLVYEIRERLIITV